MYTWGMGWYRPDGTGAAASVALRAANRLLWLVAVLLAGCATPLPQVDRERIASQAVMASRDTALGRMVADSSPDPELSGFRLMPLGAFSFDARLALAQRAERSLDVQYYHLENDDVGRLLLRALRDAAERGVRVRLLIDDYYTGGSDALFLAFAAHPNVQVRLFNPFCCLRDAGSRTRFAASIGDWGRVNHRMHNKLFIADGTAAVIGGRNIAEAYFPRRAGNNFIDLDAFVVGAVVDPLGWLFDRYWNSRPVYPLETIARSLLDPAQQRDWFERITGPAYTAAPPTLPASDILGYGPVRDDLNDGRLGLIWADARAFADHPDKPFDGSVGGELHETSVTYNVFETIREAKSEVMISSPYFVPGPRGMQLLRELRERGVKVTVLTNSLGATDEPLVHLGYSRYREELLRMGVDLYELSSSRVKLNKRMFHFGESLGTLHSKLVVIDRRLSYIGSKNLDPRSATINTELGAFIDSPQLARELSRVIDLDRLQSAYRVRLAGDGSRLEWLGLDDEAEIVLTNEPDAPAWLRLQLLLLRPWVPEELL
jgi:putative cardiolipin synthase